MPRSIQEKGTPGSRDWIDIAGALDYALHSYQVQISIHVETKPTAFESGLLCIVTAVPLPDSQFSRICSGNTVEIAGRGLFELPSFVHDCILEILEGYDRIHREALDWKVS